MLEEFLVENYRSMKNEQILSLAASNRKDKEDSNILQYNANYTGKVNRVLPTAALYGPNASGKSTLLNALQTMRRIIVRQAPDDSTELPIVPFLLDDNRSKSTTFQVILIIDNIRYQYGFCASRSKVEQEWLYAWPKGRLQVWLDRDETQNAWKIGDQITGSKETWRKATRKNALFLSTAIMLNSKSVRPIYNWFSRRLKILEGGIRNPIYTNRRLEDGDTELVLEFLQNADLAVNDVRLETIDLERNVTSENLSSDEDSNERDRIINRRYKKPWLSHITKEGDSVEFELRDESGGTRALYGWAGTWIESLTSGETLIVDELDTHLHPHVARFLIELFHNPEINRNYAQLIFTTHNTSLLNRKIFRRDQIWFCDRNQRGESILFPFSNFKTRNDLMNWESSYLNGRFGGIPDVKGSLGLNHL